MPRRTKRDPYAQAVRAGAQAHNCTCSLCLKSVRESLVAAVPHMPLPREVAALVRAARRWNDGGSTGDLCIALKQFAGADRARRGKGTR